MKASIMEAKDLEYPYEIEGVWIVNLSEEDFFWELDHLWVPRLKEWLNKSDLDAE